MNFTNFTVLCFEIPGGSIAAPGGVKKCIFRVNQHHDATWHKSGPVGQQNMTISTPNKDELDGQPIDCL